MKPLRYRPPGADYEFHVYGHRSQPLRDFYHALLRLSWTWTISALAAIFLAANAVFGGIYVLTGGVKGVDGFLDAFFFSVQTMGTVGYGAMYPATHLANWVMTAEAITGLALTALATGLVFAKFSRPNARIVFSHEMAISNYDGKPTLMFRLGNERANQIVDARIRVMLVRSEKTLEGKPVYRTYDLPLTRERMLSLSRSWTVLHRIDEKSPLYGATPESVKKDEVELQAMVIGTDDITMHQVHAQHLWYSHEILFGRRHVDILKEQPKDVLVLDLRKFHDTEAAA